MGEMVHLLSSDVYPTAKEVMSACKKFLQQVGGKRHMYCVLGSPLVVLGDDAITSRT